MTQHTNDAVRLTRTFAASRETLWRMWTDPDEFAAWYGPDGAVVEVAELDLRPGGRRLVSMRLETPGGRMTMTFVGEFREVVRPTRLVYTESLSDDGGRGSGAETVVEVELLEDGAGTTVVLTHHGIPAGSPGEAGWLMALDHLATHACAT